MLKIAWTLLLTLSLFSAVCAEEDDPGSGWWSFDPVRVVVVPSVGSGANPANPIDAFIRLRLKKEGIKPSRPASPAILARRLHFDLLGLPPAPGVVEEFAGDPSPEAYRELVETELGLADQAARAPVAAGGDQRD